MKFKDGSNVEVLCPEKSPHASWWTAVIITGKSHYYEIVYDIRPPHMGQKIVDKVHCKDIRPCPPKQCPKSWSPGNAAEVFHNGSWNKSIVKEEAGDDYYFISLHSLLDEIKVHNSQLRSIQSWKEPKWETIQEDCKDHDQNRIGSHCHYVPCESAMSLNSTNVPKSPHAISSRGVKRKVPAKTYGHRPTKKTKMVSKDDRQLDLTTIIPEKIDVFAPSPKELDGKYIHAVYKRGRYPEKKRANNLHRDDACSSTGSNIPHHTVADQSLALDTFRHARDMDAEVHRVEVQAYRTTLQALYASGSFSWSQEMMLTDLRIFLNISDDEHRLELKYLKSIS